MARELASSPPILSYLNKMSKYILTALCVYGIARRIPTLTLHEVATFMCGVGTAVVVWSWYEYFNKGEEEK